MRKSEQQVAEARKFLAGMGFGLPVGSMSDDRVWQYISAEYPGGARGFKADFNKGLFA